MMRFATIAALLTALNGVEAKVSIAKLPATLSNEHGEAIGQAHTEAFDMLKEKYADERPSSKEQMMKDMGEIMASFCDDEDTKESCMTMAHNCADLDMSDVICPDNLDPKLLMKVDDIYTTLNTLQEDNVHDTLEKLNAIKEEIKVMDVDPVHKHAAVSGAAVAVESTKLWTAVYTNADHPLFGIHHSSYYLPKESVTGDKANIELNSMHEHHRKLDTTTNCIPPVPATPHTHDYYEEDNWVWIPGWGWTWVPILGGLTGGSDATEGIGSLLPFLGDRFNIIDIVQADVDGAFFAIFDESDGNPVVIISPTLLFTTAFVGATTRSSTWALSPPTPAPSSTPSLSPTISCAPTGTPTISRAPIGVPSKVPTKVPTVAPVAATAAPVAATAAPVVATAAPVVATAAPVAATTNSTRL